MELNRYTRGLKSVAIFDPSIATRNIGDEIISDAARSQIAKLLPEYFQATVPTHENIGIRSYRFAKQSKYRFIAGSNILTGKMLLDRQWRIKPWDALFVSDLVGLGVGWREYGQSKNGLSDFFLKKLLSSKYKHSVRDGHTVTELASRGVSNVLNTACVTMWDLDVSALARLPEASAKNVVTTLNIGRSSEHDLAFVKLLADEYETVYLWPQGIDDEPLIDSVIAQVPGVKRLGATLRHYDELLRAGDIEFFGNRLHGGIRALQHGKRATILTVDNRASEIAKDTNLPVVSAEIGLDSVRSNIRSPSKIELKLPLAAIEEWKSQF